LTFIVYDIVNILLWDGNGKEWEFPHGNGMGMGISHKIGNRNGKEWEWIAWEWEGVGI